MVVVAAERSALVVNLFTGIRAACDRFYLGRDPAGAVELVERLLVAAEDHEQDPPDTAILADIALLDDLRQVLLRYVGRGRQVERRSPVADDVQFGSGSGVRSEKMGCTFESC